MRTRTRPPAKAPDPHPRQAIRHRARRGTFKRPLQPDNAPATPDKATAGQPTTSTGETDD
jgi:hypothetical protein